MIVLSRIDSRLIHGQVVEAWLPHLDVRRVVVADDDAATDALTQAAFGLAVPAGIELMATAVTATDYPRLNADHVRTLVLFRTVQNVVLAREKGLPDGALNVGNVHAAPGRVEVTRSVFLNREESAALIRLRSSGMTVVIQAVPADKPTPLPA